MRFIAAARFYLKRQDYVKPFFVMWLMAWLAVTVFHYIDNVLFQSTRMIVESYLFALGLLVVGELIRFLAYVTYVCWHCRGCILLNLPEGYNQPYHEYRAWLWTPAQYSKLQRTRHDSPERITGSAVRGLDGTVYCVERPGRHHHCINLMTQLKQGELSVRGNTRDQGFITNHNRYLSRLQARALAIMNGQVEEKKLITPKVIFSEDLWDTPPRMQHRP